MKWHLLQSNDALHICFSKNNVKHSDRVYLQYFKALGYFTWDWTASHICHVVIAKDNGLKTLPRSTPFTDLCASEYFLEIKNKAGQCSDRGNVHTCPNKELEKLKTFLVGGCVGGYFSICENSFCSILGREISFSGHKTTCNTNFPTPPLALWRVVFFFVRPSSL